MQGRGEIMISRGWPRNDENRKDRNVKLMVGDDDGEHCLMGKNIEGTEWVELGMKDR